MAAQVVAHGFDIKAGQNASVTYVGGENNANAGAVEAKAKDVGDLEVFFPLQSPMVGFARTTEAWIDCDVQLDAKVKSVSVFLGRNQVLLDKNPQHNVNQHYFHARNDLVAVDPTIRPIRTEPLSITIGLTFPKSGSIIIIRSIRINFDKIDG
jgi:hypothetical protein